MPDELEYPSPSASRETGTAVRIPAPGAVRSSARLSLEKLAGRSSLMMAPTVRTCGESAGNAGGLPASSSKPPAATVTAPALTARRICSVSAMHSVREP